MRPIKPFAVALGGLIAAVFGAAFFGAHTGGTPAGPANGLRADLQSKSVASTTNVVVSPDAKPEGKAPKSQPHFPFQGLVRNEIPGLFDALRFQTLRGTCERLVDQRPLLLVGVVELRI
jgi:hypothetical protein